ncbi:MAG TPA: hypothetical protein VL983_03700 [Terriglobales bacterium]|nr:hypothetical protein [Terriglobales bacterium]
MTVAIRSFGKINVGLYIGARRADGFHTLRTVYQTIALHDLIRVEVGRGSKIEIECDDPRVPRDSANTCYRVAERAMDAVGVQGQVRVKIEKRLPIQGGLGAASSNAVATMLALEGALEANFKSGFKRGRQTRGRLLSGPERMRIASDVGSDLPLFLIGGTVLGVGRGEEVYPLADLPGMPVVVVTPEIGISTPRAFANWDALVERGRGTSKFSGARVVEGPQRDASGTELTHSSSSDRLVKVSCALSAWLGSNANAGAPAKGGGRAGNLLSDLVRAGIENDFERVAFSEFPELRDIKRALERAGSRYTSLSGSGSTLYGLFESAEAAKRGAKGLQKQGLKAIATRTLTRREYWSKLSVSG